jgi:ppGpp synthetase/RelA/SpoT-type nucleotidyltranferase
MLSNSCEKVVWYIRYLEPSDSDFREFWSHLPQALQWQYLAQLLDIGTLQDNLGATLHVEHIEALNSITRHFEDVGQVPLSFSKLAERVSAFTRDTEAKCVALREMHASLENVFGGSGENVYWYGQLKPAASLHRKLTRLGLDRTDVTADNQIFDAVRFRVVAPSLLGVRRTAQTFRDYFGSRVVACRNFLAYPRYSASNDTYKAIHFILLTADFKNAIEVQLMTVNREAVCLIDHFVEFKGRGNDVPADMRDWLVLFSMAANVADCMQAYGTTRFSRDSAPPHGGGLPTL